MNNKTRYILSIMVTIIIFSAIGDIILEEYSKAMKEVTKQWE